MRLTVTVIDLPRGESWDASVEAMPEATVGALAGGLITSRPKAVRELVNGRAPAPVLYVDGEPLDPGLTLADAPIRDGTVVSLDDPAGCPPPLPDGVAELRITGGPRAGAVHRLTPATWLVGKGPRANVRVDDPYLPAEAFALSLTPDVRGTLSLQPGTHARLDGEPISGRVSWPPTRRRCWSPRSARPPACGSVIPTTWTS